jgi:hypothetical protein
LDQIAQALQALASQIASSQYSNASQLTNPTQIGISVSSVA